MSQATAFDDATKPAAGAARHREQRLERLIDRLPEKLQTTIHWLRRPALRWARLPAGVLFIAGSFLSILPLFGLWMLPLGLMLLAEDIPPLRRVRDRFLDWIERHRPHWFLDWIERHRPHWFRQQRRRRQNAAVDSAFITCHRPALVCRP